MVEEQRKRVEDQMSKLIEDLDKTYLRKMQGDMHRCAVTCCENDSYSMQKVHNCIENCGSSVNNAQQYVQGEVERVQNRLQRCVMDCNDKIKDKMGPNPSQADANRYTEEFERCATKCVDTFCEMIPTLEKNMKKALSSKKYDV